MVDAIASLVLGAAKAIMQIIELNRMVGKEEEELKETCMLINSTINGISAAGQYKDVLNSMNKYLNDAKLILEHLVKRKGLVKIAEQLRPQDTLDKLKAISDKLNKMVNMLSMAFSADLVKRQQDESAQEFDSSQIINHSSAKLFWKKRFGSKTYDVAWTRFKDAFLREYKTDLNAGLMSDDNFLLVRPRLDRDNDGMVSVYEFADFSDDFGVLKSFLRVVNPEAAIDKMPESIGTTDEILKRTIFVDGVFLFDVTDPTSSIRAAIEDVGGPIHKSFKYITGCLVEFTDDSKMYSLLENSKVLVDKITNRKTNVTLGPKTVDEVLKGEIAKKNEETKQMREEKTKPEEAAAKVSLELKILEEENLHKAEQIVEQQQKKMTELEKNFEKEMKCSANMSDEQKAAHEAKLKEELEKQKLSVQMDFKMKEDRLNEEKKQAESKLMSLCPKQFLNAVTNLFGSTKEQAEKTFHENFQDQLADEHVADHFQCSATEKGFGAVPKLGRMYVTDQGVYFASHVFGSDTKLILRFEDMCVMEKRNHLVFPTAIHIEAFFNGDKQDKREHDFIGFAARNDTFAIINKMWEAYVKRTSGTLVVSDDRVVFELKFEVKKSGWLAKEGAIVKNWKDRWIVLSDRNLTYSKTKNGPPIRSIALAKVGDCRAEEKSTNNKFHFYVITKERTFIFRTNTRKEQEEWVEKIKDCLAALRLSFYYGVIVVESIHSPAWRVLEVNFAVKMVRLVYNGRVIISYPFEKIDMAKRDSENPFVFTIFLKSEDRYIYLCQSAEDREAIVDIIERITQKGTKMVEEYVRLRKNILEKEKATAKADKKKLDQVQNDINFLEKSIRDNKGGTLVEDLQRQQAFQIRRGNLQLIFSMSSPQRYVTLENRVEGPRLTVFLNDISTIPLDIISLRSCVIYKASDTRFCVYSSVAQTPFYFKAEGSTIRDDWVTSILFAMYPNLALNSQGKLENFLNTDGTIAPVETKSFSPSSTSSAPSTSLSAYSSPLSSPFMTTTTTSPLTQQSSFLPSPSAVSSSMSFSSSSPSSSSPSSVTPSSSSASVVAMAPVSGGSSEADAKRIRMLEVENQDYLTRVKTLVVQVETEQKAKEQASLGAREIERRYQIIHDGMTMKMVNLFYSFVKQGAQVNKHSKSSSPNSRFLFVNKELNLLQWCESNSEKQRKKAKEMKIGDIKEMKKGAGEENFKNKHVTEANANQCLTIVSEGANARTLDVQFESEEQRDYWVDALTKLVAREKEGKSKQHPKSP